MRHREDVSTDVLQKNNKRAFEESTRAITSLYEGSWHAKQEVVVEDTLSLTMGVSSAMGPLTQGVSDGPFRRFS